MAKMHKVSILMGIYNCQEQLPTAIESILSQSFSNIELVMCDDGSKDDTFEVARRYQEQYKDKIILLKNEHNQGLNITLNRCLKASTGDLIARQDADDRSLPERIETEVNYLDENPQCAFVSSGMIINNGERIVGYHMPQKHRPAKTDLIKRPQFYHAPMMIRREAILAVEGYTEDPRLLRVEDFNLWTKLYAKGYYGENIHQGLYEVCEDDNTYRRRNFRTFRNGAYAKLIAVDMLHLPFYYKFYAVIHICKGLLPNIIYRYLHRKSHSVMTAAPMQKK